MLTKRSKSKMQAVDMKFFKNTKREKQRIELEILEVVKQHYYRDRTETTQWFHHVKITDSESERKDCGKIKEIRNFLSINPYKMEMVLQEEEDKLKRNIQVTKPVK